ncbi:hypothetical protein [Paracoccus endophyticus]|uniref:hypothetical protein n=1 Tax=Paracoccus endophyticus TaxID=2233774 RepID=UPI000DD60F7E|nr:hypothetical protein [Paracoccus endophyticus]
MTAGAVPRTARRGPAPGGGPRPAPDGRPCVRDRLAALIGAFALDAQRAQILGCYGAIFGGALDPGSGVPPPRRSRLSEDGTPIQFATAVGPATPSLRFVGDPVLPGDGGAQGLRRACAAMDRVAAVLGLGAELDALRPLLAVLAPEDSRALRDDPAGALWIGVGFAPGIPGRMRLYLNGGWGSAAQRPDRTRAFAAHFGQAHAWRAAEARLPAALSPLGMALTLAPGRPACGALYLRAFGLGLDAYAALARQVAGPASADAIGAFGAALLGDDAARPTPSAVLSFGCGGGPGLTVDLEFCAHCLFRDDAQARQRLLGLFSTLGLDATPYLTLARHLDDGAQDAGPPRVHAFVGVDAKAAAPTCTLYMKPDLAPCPPPRS